MTQAEAQPLNSRLRDLKNLLHNSKDIIVRDFEISSPSLRGSIVYMEGIVDSKVIQSHILEPLMRAQVTEIPDELQFADKLMASVLEVKELQLVNTDKEAVQKLLGGWTVILFDTMHVMIAANTTQWNERAISTPKGQRSVKGPDVGFTEDSSKNISLIRKIIKHPELTVDDHILGTYTNTTVKLVYIQSLVDQRTLDHIKNKLKEVTNPSILSSQYIEEWLTRESKSIFPLIKNTDRPDVAASELIEGRVCMIVDGSAYVLVAPAIFTEFFQSADDYYLTSRTVSVLRPLRFILFVVSLLVPGIYVAFTTMHPDLLPMELLLGLAAQRSVVPMPTLFEVILTFILIEAIVEASNRLPQKNVLTISIFGAIVIGQSAVEAQFLQPITVVVLSLSYILTSLVPAAEMTYSIRILKIFFITIGNILGLYGIAILSLLILVHLCHLRSFGVPYLSPLAPFRLKEQKDVFIRDSFPELTQHRSSFHQEEPMESSPDSSQEEVKRR